MIPLIVPIAAAILGRLAPAAVGALTRSPRAEAVAREVVEAVKEATGQTAADPRQAGALAESIATDPALAAQVQMRLFDVMMAQEAAEAEAARDRAQLDLAQAQHASLFVAGARPAMLWAAASGLLMQFVALPAVWLVFVALALSRGQTPPDMPVMDISALLALAGTGAGLYGLRGVEKAKGVARDNLGGPGAFRSG